MALIPNKLSGTIPPSISMGTALSSVNNLIPQIATSECVATETRRGWSPLLRTAGLATTGGNIDKIKIICYYNKTLFSSRQLL